MKGHDSPLILGRCQWIDGASPRRKESYSRNTKPPQTPASTVASPYVRPKPRATAEDLLVPEGEEPPNPVNVFCPVAVASAVLLAAPAPVVVEAIVLMVEVFTRIGSWAPHGFSDRQALWQDESFGAQLLTQSVAA